jgi:hypothetical protein
MCVCARFFDVYKIEIQNCVRYFKQKKIIWN